MTTTAAYCASIDIIRNAPSNDRETFLLDKLRDTLEDLLESRDRVESLEDMLNKEAYSGEDYEDTLKRIIEERDKYERSHDELPEVKQDVEHHREDAKALREEKAEMARDLDAMRARAERAESLVEEILREVRALTVTRRGNTLHLHLPRVLHRPAPGFNHDWNTISVPVIAKGKGKIDYTWLSYTEVRQVGEP